MFTKKDLKNGDVIVRQNGSVEVVIVDIGVLVTNECWNNLCDVRDDLTDCDSDYFGTEYDIVKVYRPREKYQCQFNPCQYTKGELVYDRERDTKKPLYNGKVVCIDHCGCNASLYTVGKIYQFVDGSFVADDGTETKTYYHPFESFKEWQEFSSSKWLEIKE